MKFVVSGAFLSPERLIPLAQAAEDCGYEAMAFPDHVVYPETLDTPYPYTEDGERRYDSASEFPDPWVTIGALASVTKRLRFMTAVYVLPLRNPFHAAKQIATAARFAQGRIVVTVGVGWSNVEFEIVGEAFKHRGARTDEMIELMKKLWSGKIIEGEGDFYSFPRLQLAPPFPKQAIPIWAGGISDFALHRAARHDGWLSDLQTSADILESIVKVQGYRQELGRQGAFDVMASALDAGDIDAYRRLEEGGVTHVLTNPWVFTHGFTEDPDLQRDGLKRFADDIIAKMN